MVIAMLMPCTNRERGQATVEFAVICPFLIIMALVGIQAAWNLYCGSCLEQATKYAAYSVQADDASTGDAAAAIIEEKLKAAQPVLNSGQLAVSDARIVCVDNVVRTEDLSDEDFDNYLIATKNQLSRRLDVEATITYEPPMLFNVGLPSSYTRQIDSSMTIDETFELG